MNIPDSHLVLHGLAIKKHADAAAVAKLVGLSSERVRAALADAVKRGRAAEAQGRYLLAPMARMALDGEYSKFYDGLRRSADFVAAYEGFEKINVDLKQLITDWQTLEIAGQRVPNDHSKKAHDERVIDRLGKLHERADKLFAKLAAGLPRCRSTATTCSQRWRKRKTARSSGSAMRGSTATTPCGSSCTKNCCG